MRNHEPTSRPLAQRRKGCGSRLSYLLGALAVLVLALPSAVSAQYATGGSGLYKNNILWFQWGAKNQVIPTALTKTNTFLVNGLPFAVTCSISTPSPALRAYASGSFAGDGLDDLYNIGGIGAANSLVYGLRNNVTPSVTTFSFSCSATLDGDPFPLPGLVVGDAETQAGAEFLRVTATTGTWRLIDRFRTCALSSRTVLTGLQLQFDNPGGFCSPGAGPMTVYFLDGGTSANVLINEPGGGGAIALGVLVQVADRGDAPASYGAANHILPSTFTGGAIPAGTTNNVNDPAFALATLASPVPRFGALVDAEPSELFSPNADGDDNNGSDDEDAFPPGPLPQTGLLMPGDPYQLTVPCTGLGTVAGWVDWDGNGVFDNPSERSAAASCSGASVNLSWTVPPSLSRGPTFVRLRIATDPATAQVPTGLAADGETEDHALLIPQPVVQILKTSSSALAIPGGTLTYTITASNTGTVDATGTNLTDPMPVGITSYLWTCAASGGAVCPSASGSGGINETLTAFPPGGQVVYTVTATVSASPPANIVNTAVGTPPDGGLCFPGNTPPPCTSTTTTPPVPVVSVSKTVDGSVATPGSTLTYSISAINTSSVAAAGTTISDPVPAGITAVSWTCAASGGAVCPNASGTGAINETITTFPAASSVTYTVTATVADNPPASITNAVTVTPPPDGICGDGSAPPCTTGITLPATPQVSVTKTSNVTVLTPGGTVIYTVTVTNTGSVPAPGTQVNDPVPTGITAFAWTCAASGGAVCPNAGGSGGINETIATLPAGGQVVYTINATVSGTPPASVANTSSVTPPGGALCTPGNTPPPCTTTVSVPPVPVVGVTKTADLSSVVPGGTLVYSLVVSNVGSVAAPGSVISDPIPAGLSAYNWTCAASGGAVCPNAAGAGAINETIATFPAGSSLTYTITATVDAAPPAQIANTASLTPPADSLCVDGSVPPCSTTHIVAPVPQVSVTKTSPDATAVPGGTITYTITVSNTGSAAAAGTAVSDPLPNGIASSTWTCAASGGAVCPNASGSGGLNQTIATLPAGGSVTYTITATVSDNPPATVGNTVAVTPPGGALCTPGDTPPPCGSGVTTPSAGQVGIVKTVTPDTAGPGEELTYTLSIVNNGGSPADGTQVSDPVAPGIASYSWTCAASGGAVCPNASGTGDLNETIATLPPNGLVVYTITATVGGSPPEVLDNLATITPPTGAVCSGPCTATASVLGLLPVQAIPTLEGWGLALLGTLLGLASLRLLRRRGRSLEG